MTSNFIVLEIAPLHTILFSPLAQNQTSQMSSSLSQSPGPESPIAIPAQSRIQPAQKIKGRKGKAGGTGKKGKVFVEDKVCLPFR